MHPSPPPRTKYEDYDKKIRKIQKRTESNEVRQFKQKMLEMI